MKIKSGFTLIEMLVAVLVFMILFLIAASFVNLAAGSTKSNRTKMLTGEVRNAFDIISQKMNNANTVDSHPPINGFRALNNILGSATSDGKCTFIGRSTENNIGYLAMVIDDCASISGWPATITDLNNPGRNVYIQRVTSSNVNITAFSVNMTPNNWLPSMTIAPTVTVAVTAQDAEPKYAASNQITLKTTYTMDYATIKRLQAQ